MGAGIVSIVGAGSAAAARTAHALLAANGVEHRWLDTDSDPLGRLLVERGDFDADRAAAVCLPTARGSRRPSHTWRSRRGATTTGRWRSEPTARPRSE